MSLLFSKELIVIFYRLLLNNVFYTYLGSFYILERYYSVYCRAMSDVIIETGQTDNVAFVPNQRSD